MKFDREEFALRGDAAYDRFVRPVLTDADYGKFVVLEVETGDFEIDCDELTADDRMRERSPERIFWLRRIGHAAARRH